MASGMTDWRGTPIEIGSRVLTHALGKYPQRAIGTVTKLGDRTVTVKVEQRDSRYHTGTHSVLGPGSVLVLTEDLLRVPANKGPDD